MDQNYNQQPIKPDSPQPVVYNQLPNQIRQAGRPSPSSGKRKIFALFISILMLLAIGLASASLIMVGTKANRADQATKTEDIEKRLKVIEEADKYTEKQIVKNQYQGVFLNGGQVYFGQITEITKDTLKLEDIYYLKTGNVDKAGNPLAGGEVSLTKLGNELHGPEDVMYIERKNITFWENLKNDGQVSKAIDQYKKANPTTRN